MYPGALSIRAARQQPHDDGLKLFANVLAASWILLGARLGSVQKPFATPPDMTDNMELHGEIFAGPLAQSVIELVYWLTSHWAPPLIPSPGGLCRALRATWMSLDPPLIVLPHLAGFLVEIIDFS